MEPLTFRHQQRITYAQCTVGNHVYYARYLDLLEAARGEFFRALGRPLIALQNEGLAFPVTECRFQCFEPARYDELVTTDLWLTRAKGVRIHVSYRLMNERGVACLEAETRHACVSLEEKPRRIPHDLLTRLQPYLHVPVRAE